MNSKEPIGQKIKNAMQDMRETKNILKQISVFSEAKEKEIAEKTAAANSKIRDLKQKADKALSDGNIEEYRRIISDIAK